MQTIASASAHGAIARASVQGAMLRQSFPVWTM
jgi:hypothetical protein